ncbi:MAG: DapH/DapD/GlmU-related protein [Candidatus Nanoarchaeia archaeon]|nr:DapH/DapD/GlmU-related protein [Candidatus Nanoarchaeia archaeon]
MLTESLRGFNLVLVSISFLTIVLWPAVLIYYLFQNFYNWVNIAWLFPLFVYFGFLSYGILFLIQSYVFLKIIFNPKEKTGNFDINKPNKAIIYYSISSIFMRIIEKIFSILLIPTVFYANLIFKLFAKHCGKKSLINPIPDPYLISIGDECVMGRGVLIIGHEISGTRIIIKEVLIGNRVTIGANSIISPGVIIEDDVIVGANSYVKKDSVLEKGGFYVGNPAKLKKRKLISK